MGPKLLVLLVLALTVAPSPAQSVDFHRFYPLEIGDTWDYQLREQTCVFSDCETDFEGYVRRTVVADTTIDSEAWSVLTVERLSLDAEVLSTSRCVARVSADGEVDFERVSGPCEVLERRDSIAGLWNLQEGRSDEVNAVVEIGGGEYVVDVLRSYAEGAMGETTFRAATDIGVVDYFGSAGPDQSRAFWDSHLVYARVGGVTYGVAPVANEDEAAPAAFALGAAYPNPFRSTVTLVLSLPTAEPVTLRVFDVLGRRVLLRDLGPQPEGATPHRLDLSGLPAGAYVIRARAASGETAERGVTKVE